MENVQMSPSLFFFFFRVAPRKHMKAVMHTTFIYEFSISLYPSDLVPDNAETARLTYARAQNPKKEGLNSDGHGQTDVEQRVEEINGIANHEQLTDEPTSSPFRETF